jgi:hypothetical protein
MELAVMTGDILGIAMVSPPFNIHPALHAAPVVGFSWTRVNLPGRREAIADCGTRRRVAAGGI